MNDALADISVFLVEDNSDDEWITLRVLTKTGLARVTVARDGFEALQMLHGESTDGGRAETGSPDLIILDLRLPKIDGLEVLKRIRSDARTKNCAVLVLTSSEDPHDTEVCAALGVAAFAPKPLKKEDIEKLNLFNCPPSPSR
jgi:two-component system response regulator